MSGLLKLTFLGAPRISLSDLSLNEQIKGKHLALFVYLATTGRVHMRDAIADLLWSEMSNAQALKNLRDVVADLRKTVGNYLEITRQTLAFNRRSHYWLDVEVFHTTVLTEATKTAPQALQAVVDLYQQEFLAGFSVRNAPIFEEWVTLQREQLHSLAVQGLTLLGTLYLEQHNYEAGLVVNRRWLLFDPESEAAHRQRMHLLAASGQRSAALAQYEACLHMLEEEFGVAPEAATMALYKQIKAGAFDGASAQAGKVKSRAESIFHHTGIQINEHELPRETIFYGRQNELAQLQQWLVNQRCRLVGIFGMGGQGKTALAAHLVRLLGKERRFEYILWCSLLNAPPLGEVLPQWIRVLSGHQVLHLPDQLDEQLVLLFRYLEQHRCLLILDNIESILQPDDAMGRFRTTYAAYGQLLQWMGSRSHASCLLLTGRERPIGFNRLEQDLAKVQSLTLQGLPVETSREFLQALQIASSAEAIEVLVNYYSGNPLALKLVATTVRDFFAGDLTAFLSDKALIFDDIRQVLDQHFARLAPLERTILFWLAIHREPIVFSTLWTNLVQPPSRRAVLEALSSLQRRLLVESYGEGFGLQNVVMEYATDRFIETLYTELIAGQVHLFNDHALMLAQAKEYVRESQQRMILQPIAERLLNDWGTTGVVSALRPRLAHLQNSKAANASPVPGYAAANLLHLLLYWQIDLRGYDFSRLSIWQADLRRVNLPGVNFTQSDLKGCAFTEPIETVRALNFSPDGQWLAIGTADGEICVWRLSDRQPWLTLHGHTGPIYALAFCADSARLASASGDRTVRLWDLATGKVQRILDGNLDEVLAVAFDIKNQSILSIGQDGAVWRWNLHQAAVSEGLQFYATAGGTPHYVMGTAINQVEGLVATGGADGIVRCWQAQTGQLRYTLVGHISLVTSLAFRPDGKMLASSSKDMTVRLWALDKAVGADEQPSNEQSQARLVLSSLNGRLAFSPDGRMLLGSTGNLLWLCDTVTGQLCHQLTGHSTWFSALAYHSDSRTVASASYDQTVRIWDVQKGRAEYVLTGLSHWMDHVRFSPDGATLACSQFDHTVHLWTHTGRHLHTLRSHKSNVRVLVYSPDGQLLATGSDDTTVCLWEVQTGRQLYTLRGHSDVLSALAFSPDGALLVSGSFTVDEQMPTSVCLWDVVTGELRTTLSRPRNRVWCATFHPDGMRLALGSTDQTVCIWDMHTFKLQTVLVGHTAAVRTLAFHPNGRLLASGGDDSTIRLWNLERSQLCQTLLGHTHTVSSIIFSPDGKRLISASDDQTMRVWAWVEAVAQWQLRLTLPEKLFKFNCVALSPDGTTLISGSLDSNVHVWDVETGELRRTLQGHTNLITAIDISPDGQRVISSSSDGTVRLWEIKTGTCLCTLKPQGPYVGLNLTDAMGISATQRAALKSLGAIEQLSL